MSGLVFDPTDPSVLWAVKNKSWVFRLVQQGDTWVPDTVNDWGAGKQIFFPGGVGQPDSEGLTVGADGALYITTERDNSNNAFSLELGPAVRPDRGGHHSDAHPAVEPHHRLPRVGAARPGHRRAGAEQGPRQPRLRGRHVRAGHLPRAERLRRPVDQLGVLPERLSESRHGLYFAALENDGKLYAYALNSDGTAHRVAVVDTGMGHVMDVQYDAGLQRIWALCDNTCSVSSTLLKVDTTGAMVPDVVYARPAGDAGVGALPNVNIEGFAIAADSTCVDGFKEAVWSDDGIAAVGHEGHALYRGTFPCGLDLGEQGAPAAVDLGARGVGDVTAAKKSTLHVHGSGFVPGETVRDRTSREEEDRRARLGGRRRLRPGDRRRGDPHGRATRRAGGLARRPVRHRDRRRVDRNTRSRMTCRCGG